MLKRISLIVYFKTPKVLRRVRKICNVSYYHKKRRYAVVYTDENKMNDVMNRLKQLRHVRNVEQSHVNMERYEINMDVK